MQLQQQLEAAKSHQEWLDEEEETNDLLAEEDHLAEEGALGELAARVLRPVEWSRRSRGLQRSGHREV